MTALDAGIGVPAASPDTHQKPGRLAGPTHMQARLIRRFQTPQVRALMKINTGIQQAKQFEALTSRRVAHPNRARRPGPQEPGAATVHGTEHPAARVLESRTSPQPALNGAWPAGLLRSCRC